MRHHDTIPLTAVGKKSLLVLAASRHQVESIQTAKRLGYRVISSDNVPGNPGHALADQAYHVDTADRESILALAQREQIAGVISPCTDVAVPTAAFVAERMGLFGPPVSAAQILCDKAAFRYFLKSNGLPVPRFFILDGPSLLPKAMFENQSWIVKPDCSSGSKGIFIVRSHDALESRLPETLSFSPNGRAVIEEFIEGFQGTCEGILKEGKIAAACFLDRQTVAPPYVATCGHRIPTSLPPHVQHRTIDTLERIWQLLGVTNTVFDCDFVVSAEEVFILEMSPRLGGNCISSLLLKSSGFSFVEYAIRSACNESPAPPQSLNLKPIAVMILGSPRSGHVVYDTEGVRSLEHCDWIDSLVIDVKLGEPVQGFINGRHRIGECFVHGSSYEDVCAKSCEVLARLRIGVN